MCYIFVPGDLTMGVISKLPQGYNQIICSGKFLVNGSIDVTKMDGVKVVIASNISDKVKKQLTLAEISFYELEKNEIFSIISLGKTDLTFQGEKKVLKVFNGDKKTSLLTFKLNMD